MATTRSLNLIKALGLDKHSQEQRLKRIAAATWSRWRGLTNGLKPRYRGPYQAAMAVRVQGTKIILTLDGGVMARSVEYGFGPGGVGTFGPYDMRRTLLKSPKAKMGPKGKYMNVPMGMPTRKMRGMQGGERAYAAAKQLSLTARTKGGTLWGGSLPHGMTPKLRPQGRRVPGIGYVPPHRNSPTDSLYRRRSGKGRSQYFSFRTISQGGKPWVHPGIKPRRFIRKVAKMVPAIVREVG